MSKRAVTALVNVTGSKTWPISKIKPYKKNPRRHSASQIAKIVQSIEEFGWTIPLLVTPKGELIAGHGRLLAARKLGMKTVPVLIASDLTQAQIRAYRIADNSLTDLGVWGRRPAVWGTSLPQRDGF